MWVPDRWQENLLWHFLRTGDYWCGPTKNRDYNPTPAIIIVGGNHEDLKKLYAIREILLGQVVRCGDDFKGFGNCWGYFWISNENTEDYLRWFEDKWENRNIIDSPHRRHWVKDCLEAIDESNRDR